MRYRYHKIESEASKFNRRVKPIVAMIRYDAGSTETHEFNTAEECANFLGMLTFEVQIMGDEHLVVKQKDRTVSVICDDLKLSRIQETSEYHPTYHTEKGIVWVPLDQPIGEYVEINNVGLLRKRNSRGEWSQKRVGYEGKQAVYRFNTGDGQEVIEVKDIFEAHKPKFDEAFKGRKEKRRGKQAAMQA